MSKLTYASMRKAYLSHVGTAHDTEFSRLIAQNSNFYNLCREDMINHNGSYLTIVNTYHTMHLAYTYKATGYSDNGKYYIAYITPEERYDVPISKASLEEVTIL